MLDHVVCNTTVLSQSGLFSRQWGSKVPGGKFGTDPKPGDDSHKLRAKAARWKTYKNKWQHIKLATDPKVAKHKRSGVDTLLNAASSRPQSAPPVRQTSQQSSMVQSFSPIDVHPRSRKHEPSKSGHIQCRARSRRPFTAATTRSQELKEKLSHGEALYKEFGPHSRVMAHTAVGARRAQSAQALRSIVHDYSPEVYQQVRQRAASPADSFLQGLLFGPMSQLATGCGAQIVPETTPRGTTTVRIVFNEPSQNSPSSRRPSFAASSRSSKAEDPSHEALHESDLAATVPISQDTVEPECRVHASPSSKEHIICEASPSSTWSPLSGDGPTEMVDDLGEEHEQDDEGEEVEWNVSFEEEESSQAPLPQTEHTEVPTATEPGRARNQHEPAQIHNEYETPSGLDEALLAARPPLIELDITQPQEGEDLPGLTKHEKDKTQKLYDLLMSDPSAGVDELYALDTTGQWKEAKGILKAGRDEGMSEKTSFSPSPLVQMQQKEISRFKHTGSVRGQLRGYASIWEPEVMSMRREAGERRSRLQAALQSGAATESVEADNRLGEADAWQVKFETECDRCHELVQERDALLTQMGPQHEPGEELLNAQAKSINICHCAPSQQATQECVFVEEAG